MSEDEQAPAQRPLTAAASGRAPQRARLERIFDHTDDVRSLFLRGLKQALPAFTPGMFISLIVPLAEGERLRPYTIASSPEAGEPFEIVFNRVPGGIGTTWLYTRAVGDELAFTGPWGAFTLATAPAAELVFIAASTAFAPLRPMLQRALAGRPAARVAVLYAADREDHLLYRDETAALAAAHPGLHLTTLVVPGGDARLYARLADEVRRRWIDADRDRTRHFYICGVGSGVIDLRDLLRGAGYERRAVHYEKW